MKISIVIPTFNQAAFLEETLRSVLDQNYPDLELIVVDGGSTDGTVRVLETYAPRLAWWVSERDRGQTDAINKGLGRITGEVWSYLNSDDLLAPGALRRMRECFANPDVSWVGAVSTIFDKTGERGRIEPAPAQRPRDYLTPWSRPMQHIFPCSNVCFMRRAILDRCGLFDESYHYSMDMEYYTRVTFAGFSMLRIPDVLGHWRWHDSSKTMTDGIAWRFLEAELRIAEHFLPRLDPPERAEVAREITEMHRQLAVRRAQHTAGSRSDRLQRLLREGRAMPSLLWFRPWLGAVRRVFFPV